MEYFCLVLIQILILGFIPFLGTASRCYRYNRFAVVHATDGIYIIPDDDDQTHQNDIDQWLNSPSLIDIDGVLVRPLTTYGPIPGVFEYYRSERCLSSLRDLAWPFEMNLSDAQRDDVFRGLVAAAKKDSWLCNYSPGMPQRFTFAPALLRGSMIQLSLFFGFPALVTWMIQFAEKRLNSFASSKPGQCIHCAYDCTNLPTPICPECGQNPTLSTSA